MRIMDEGTEREMQAVERKVVEEYEAAERAADRRAVRWQFAELVIFVAVLCGIWALVMWVLL